MRTFSSILSIATLAMVVSASNLPAAVNKLAVNVGCANAQLTSTHTVVVGTKKVVQNELLCTLKGGAVARAANTNTISVSGQSCTTSCSNVSGILPPTSEDCETILQAFKIFKGNGPSSFVTQPQAMNVWSFGTCAYMFANFSPDTPLEFGFDDLAIRGPEAGAACFPPHQPFSPQGWCTGEAGLWAAGASHS
ncbi:hypothetical protein ONZ45_g1770 [Pleurotus djamor]|nr:hypothetical protein ONZ45_g1770 [Pleurotus djamor]